MKLAIANRISEEEYLAGEMISAVKHEYVAGEVFAMAGASKMHATIAGNIFSALRVHLRGSPEQAMQRLARAVDEALKVTAPL